MRADFMQASVLKRLVDGRNLEDGKLVGVTVLRCQEFPTFWSSSTVSCI
jgi:hypothetical protein